MDANERGPRRPLLGVSALIAVLLGTLAYGWLAANAPSRVPKLLGKTRDEAIIDVREAGFRPIVRSVPWSFAGKVVTQTPEPGVRMKPGATVEFSVGVKR